MNSQLLNSKKYSLILKGLTALIFSLFFISASVNAKDVETPYGPVKTLDFNLYGEYYATRSLIEYNGSEFGAGVVTDLVFSLTEENIMKKRGETSIVDRFNHFCAPCHGETGNGEGQFAAASLSPKPANLSDAGFMASINDAHISSVITGGSASVGKSNLCPPWGMTFEKRWISELASYVRTLSAPKETPGAQVADATADATAAGDDEEGGSVAMWIILGFATAFFVGVAVLEWNWFLNKK